MDDDESGDDISPSDFLSECEGEEIEDAPLISRSGWEAMQAKNLNPLEHPVRYVWFIYNTDTDLCQTENECKQAMRSLQKRCMKNDKMKDIPFNFMIGGDGRVYEARGWNYQPPKSKHLPVCNGQRVDIGYFGRLHRKKLSYRMIKGGLDIISSGLNNKVLARTFETTEWVKVGERQKNKYDQPSILA